MEQCKLSHTCKWYNSLSGKCLKCEDMDRFEEIKPDPLDELYDELFGGNDE